MHKKNLRLLFGYIAKRHSIYKRRFLEGMKAPWTKDPILREFRFTNVFRDLDIGTKYFVDTILPKCTNPKMVIFNAIIYRFINNIKTINHLGIQDPDNFSIELFECKLRDWKNDGNRVFTNAYMVSGYWSINPGMDKITKTCTIMGWIHKDIRKITAQIMAGEDWVDKWESSDVTYKTLLNIKGLGVFLAYQIGVDLGYWNPKIFNEDLYTIAGPGCRNGLKLVFRDKGDYSWEDLILFLVKNQNKVWKELGLDPDEIFNDRPIRRLNLMAMENCLCEISKYLRAFYNKGRPRNKYHYKHSDLVR